jgi:putative chitinase
VARIVEIFRSAAPSARAEYVRAFEQGDALLRDHGITTPLRIAHFLAQVLHECGDGTVTFENLSYTTKTRLLQIFGVGRHSAAIRDGEVAGLLRNPEALAERVYGLGNPSKARELGNHQRGDAFRYRGGGLLQTTGGDAYRRFGERCEVDFAGQPELIVSAEHALKPALQEWKDGNLNAAADRNDIRAITRRINGGFNGLEDRKQRFERIWPLVRGDSPAAAWQAGDDDPDTLSLQKALNTLGFEPRLAEDGRFGPATEEAVRWFQRLARLRVDGNPGPVTRAAIELRLSVIR